MARNPAIHLAFATGRTKPSALQALKAVESKGPQTLVPRRAESRGSIFSDSLLLPLLLK